MPRLTLRAESSLVSHPTVREALSALVPAHRSLPGDIVAICRDFTLRPGDSFASALSGGAYWAQDAHCFLPQRLMGMDPVRRGPAALALGLIFEDDLPPMVAFSDTFALPLDEKRSHFRIFHIANALLVVRFDPELGGASMEDDKAQERLSRDMCAIVAPDLSHHQMIETLAALGELASDLVSWRVVERHFAAMRSEEERAAARRQVVILPPE